MKDNILPIVLLIMMIILVGVLLVLIVDKNEPINNNELIDEDAQVTLQIIEYNNANGNERKVEERKAKIGDLIELNEEGGNNIKILEITDEYIKISRDKTRYKVLNYDYGAVGDFESYIETVVEEIEYDKEIPMNIDEEPPLGHFITEKVCYIKFIR